MGVHDSYWTHPSDATKLNYILREKFIDLHSSPLLNNLHDNFVSRYPHEKFPAIPTLGDFDLNEVKNSAYFFS